MDTHRFDDGGEAVHSLTLNGVFRIDTGSPSEFADVRDKLDGAHAVVVCGLEAFGADLLG
jgi:hypothetical protein